MSEANALDAYIKSIFPDLIAHLSAMGGKASGDRIKRIICPSCNEPEAWTTVADPSTIHCNRKNNCGVSTHVKDFAPHLWSNWAKRHPATDDDPNATARNYLLGRGLDVSKFKFEQTTHRQRGFKPVPAVAIECSWTSRRWLRLIDVPKGIEGKTRWGKGEGDAYQGHAWINRNQVDPDNELWFTEGIFNTISLEQVGIQSASTFSSSHVPTEFLEGLAKTQPIVVALDSDNAGQKGTVTLIEALKANGFTNIKAAQSPYGKDWNDLLVTGALQADTKQGTIEEALWRGRLLLAETFAEYRKVYEERRHGEDGHYHGLLEYRGQTWFCGTKAVKDEVEPTQIKVCDAIIRRAFTQLVEEREYNWEHRYFLRVNPVGRRSRTVEASAAELVSGNQARIMLKQRADVLLLDSSTPVINALVTRLERDKAPVVRLVDRLGYDPKSNCWLFGRFLYTNEGRRVEANKEGYFERQEVRCKTSEIITSTYKLTELKKTITLLHRIYGNTGIYALAYYVAASLKHEFMEREQAFPFVSFVGPKGAGKTTLIYFLNNVFFQAWEGIVAARNTTSKALSRKLYHRSSLVAPYLESNNALINIDENSLLNAYQGGSLYDRAATSNDADTISLPFDAALAFVQNVEPFRSGPLKERVITLSFKNAEDGGVTDDSIAAMKELKLLDAAARAGVGHLIFQQITQIRDNILDTLDESKEVLRELGITSPRVVYHYALLLSTGQALLEIAGMSEVYTEEIQLGQELVQLATLKESTSGGDNDDATAFLDNFEQLRAGIDDRYGVTVKVELGKHYLEDEEHYYIRIEEVLRLMRTANYVVPSDIKTQLKKADTWYVDTIRTRSISDSARWDGGEKRYSWQFRKRVDQSANN